MSFCDRVERKLRHVLGRPKRYGILAESNVVLRNCTVISEVRMGMASYANDSLLRNVEMGRFCSIGRRCSIGAAAHQLSRISTHPDFENDHDNGPRTILGHDVWVGDGPVILAGLTVGTGAVVAANAVVTKDIAPYSIMGGVPARLIRKRFGEDEINKLIASEWWRFGAAANGPGSIVDALNRLTDAVEIGPHYAER